MRRLIIGSFIAIALVFSFACGNAFAQNAKVGVTGGDLTSLLGKAQSSADTSSSTASALTSDTGWQTIMETNMKTPNDHGLAFDVSVQCALVTFTGVKSRHGKEESASAKGSINVRVVLYHEDAPEVPLYAYPSEGFDAILGDKGVTFSSRFQELKATFQGICINEDGTIRIDPESGTLDCDYEEVSLLLDTLAAHAFNFYYGNTKPGIYNVQVQARAQTETAILGEEEQSSAHSDAFVGLGSMFVEEVNLVHGEVFGTTPTVTLK